MANAAVGILGFQGCIEPHEAIFDRLDVSHIRVRTPDDLAQVDRLILPGGESTTMLRFLDRYEMTEPLKRFAQSNPVWGICAGAILSARRVINPEQKSLSLMDIEAHRNFYGSQLESFSANISLTLLGEGAIEAHFIRAPMLSALEPTEGRFPVEIAAHIDGKPVFLTQGRLWASSFHLELGDDVTLHKRFLSL